MSATELGSSPSEIGTLSTRGYTLLKKIGEGSYAKVYLSEYRSTDNSDNKKYTLACKVIDTSKAPRDYVRKFLPREIDVLIKVSHPHIIHIHSIFQRKAKYYMFMRFAEKGDLLDFILKHGPIGESQARVWFRQMALGVEYIHTLNIAHRDLKCENVLVTNNYNVKITDFGFARYVMDTVENKPCKSETYCGSLSYAAPEILRGNPYYPKTADVWSLGVILYIMLNKSMPFDDTNTKRMYEQQANKKWRFRAKVSDQLSNEVKTLVTNMLEPDVNKRLNINQITSNKWFQMDARLAEMSPAEQAALNQAKEEAMSAIHTGKTKGKVASETSETSKKEVPNNDFIKVLKLEEKTFAARAHASAEEDKTEI